MEPTDQTLIAVEYIPVSNINSAALYAILAITLASNCCSAQKKNVIKSEDVRVCGDSPEKSGLTNIIGIPLHMGIELWVWGKSLGSLDGLEDEEHARTEFGFLEGYDSGLCKEWSLPGGYEAHVSDANRGF
ncbi:hypothetical protein GBA52_014395 [Prunus armeniaca]|nr:hypothetical protein GBA52_014395 [Prunus armeniaca]